MSARRGSWAPRLAMAAAMCAAAGCVAGVGAGARARRAHREPAAAFAGAGAHTLDVRTFSGSIRVTGDGGSDVRVEAVTTVEAETAAALQAALKRTSCSKA